MLDKNTEILIKLKRMLKLMLTSYAELLNGSVIKKVMRSFQSLQKKKLAQTFVMRKDIFSFHYRIHITPHNTFMRNPVHP